VDRGRDAAVGDTVAPVEPRSAATRTEHDSMGSVEVPQNARWQAQTQRAVDNFPVSGHRLDRRMIQALAAIKAEAAHVNAKLDSVGKVDADVAKAIATAADEVADGRWDDQFPVDVYQTGSGTSSNMNANEVIATLASERARDAGAIDPYDRIHPNDLVNASQSSNDVFPSAIRLAAVGAVVDDLLPALRALVGALRKKGRELDSVVKAGRTHLMDATPVTLGQELSAYAFQVGEAADRIEESLSRVGRLPLGGTAVGNGVNAPPDFGRKVVARLAKRTGLPLSVAPDRFAAQGSMDDLVELSGGLRRLAVVLLKVADDIRWMASGPNAGLAEIHLPDLQPGSSIMPGKVNPVLCEVVAQVAAQVIGNDATVAFAGSQGRFELNTYQPVVAHDLLESIALLASSTQLFAERTVAGIEADEERCRQYASASPAVATALNPLLGYEVVAALVKEARATGTPLRTLAVEQGLVDAETYDRVVDIDALARGERPAGPS
jgi:fumarate hydratase class II